VIPIPWWVCFLILAVIFLSSPVAQQKEFWGPSALLGSPRLWALLSAPRRKVRPRLLASNTFESV
jgi:hypothetical protein